MTCNLVAVIPPPPSSIYFTVITLGTIGYGDVLPTTDVERAYAMVTPPPPASSPRRGPPPPVTPTPRL